MPCMSSDGMGDAYRTDPVAQRRLDAVERKLQPTVTMPEAMLCALCRELGRGGILMQVLARVDWVRAGVTFDDFARWYVAHMDRDAIGNAP